MIARIWNWLFHACQHEWEAIEKVSLFDGKRVVNDRPVNTIYVTRCKKCGSMKRWKLQ